MMSAMKMMVGTARRPLNTLSLSQPQKSVPGMAAISKAKYAQPACLMSNPALVRRVGAQSSAP